jgi:hypothetical protein
MRAPQAILTRWGLNEWTLRPQRQANMDHYHPTPMPQPDQTGRVKDLPLKFLAVFDVPWMWIGFSLLVWFLDYLLGPSIHLSILFFFPVVAAAWHRGLMCALPLALLLPATRLLSHWAWGTPWPMAETYSNYVLRGAVLAVFALMTPHLRLQAEEVRTLRGILPICAHCKKMRDGKGVWHPFERYISRQTNLTLSNVVCPVCLQKHYGHLIARASSPPELKRDAARAGNGQSEAQQAVHEKAALTELIL